MRILLVEDDELLGDALKTGLIQLKYIVDWLKDGEQALLAVKNENFDLIILDLGLPKIMGMDVLKSMRNSNVKSPILILTAIDNIDDMVEALDSGADDYITKPCDLNELGARARALIRRTQGRAGAIIYYENITLDPAAHTVLVNGKKIDVARKEFLLLQKLLENTGKVLHKESLMQSIYGWDDDVESNALEVHIHNLRKKINVDFIKTIRGVGYIIEKQHNRG
jgi:two-component system response regulator QseB